MGSLVSSVVVTEIVTQRVEERVLSILATNDTALVTLRWWHIYVHKDEIDAFHDHLNDQKADIQFAKEIEENGKSSFCRLFDKLRQ